MTEVFALLVVVPCAYALAAAMVAAIVSVLSTIVSALFTKAKP